MGGDDPVEGLSRGLQLLWGLRERPRKGPKPGLSLEAVVAGAIEVADAEGLAAVSMSRVAEQVGYTTMSLYRYVGGKDELLVLMLDAAIGGPSPAVREGDWRARLERWSWEQLAVCRRHPWIPRIPVTQMPISPNQLAWLEAALAALADTPLTPAEKLGIATLCSGFVRNEAQLSGDLRRARRETGISEAEMNAVYGRRLARLTDPERYPTLHEMAASGLFEGPDLAGPDAAGPGAAGTGVTADGGAPDGEAGPETEPDFDFGLQRVLDGVAVYVRSRG